MSVIVTVSTRLVGSKVEEDLCISADDWEDLSEEDQNKIINDAIWDNMIDVGIRIEEN